MSLRTALANVLRDRKRRTVTYLWHALVCLPGRDYEMPNGALTDALVGLIAEGLVSSQDDGHERVYFWVHHRRGRPAGR